MNESTNTNKSEMIGLKKEENSTTLPNGLKLTLILTAVMTYRILALTFVPDLGDSIPEFWIVAFTGDILIGVTAPIIVLLLSRYRGLVVWTVGIVWHVIGIKDYSAGFQLHFVEPFDASAGNGAPIFFTIMSIVHILCISLLVRHRAYYLTDWEATMDTKTVKMPAKSGGKSVAFPTPLKLVLILSGVMLYRASLLSSISNLGDTIPEFWIVAFTGDIFVGLTALIVVPLLWKSRTLLAWTIGIIWHVIGLKDYTVGFQLHFVEPFDESLGSTPIFVFTFGIIVHIICISLLVRYRHYYLAD